MQRRRPRTACSTLPKLKNVEANPFVDQGYKNFVAEREQAFRSELAK